MPSEEIQFYLRHRHEINEWTKLDARVDAFMRDAVNEGDVGKALALLRGESGDAEVDFYVRNRSLIAEWANLQTAAGEALHTALILTANEEPGCEPYEGKRGWSGVLRRSPEFDELRAEHGALVEMAWTRQDLLSTRRGYPFPRLALSLTPAQWVDKDRHRVIEATRPVAHEFGMKRTDAWWVHWRELAPISDSQDIAAYAQACVGTLLEVSARLYPVLREAILNTA